MFHCFGNPVGLLTDFSTQAFNINYDPYGVGALAPGSGTGGGYTQNPYAFKGGIQDRASGLAKFGIRWYNPVTGTWTQQDTLDAPLDPANANRYQFTGGDPIHGLDPTGQYKNLETCFIKAGELLLSTAGVVGSLFGGPVTLALGGLLAVDTGYNVVNGYYGDC